MPRGRMLHTQLKKDAQKVATVKLAEKIADRKFRKRRKFGDVVAEHIGKFIDRLDGDTVIKIIGIGTIAYIIKPVIQSSPDIMQQIEKIGSTPFIGLDIAEIVLNRMGYQAWWKPDEAGKEVKKPEELHELHAWALSIGVACLIMVFGADIIEALGGVTGLAKLFFA